MFEIAQSNVNRIYFHYLQNYFKILKNSDLKNFDGLLLGISREVYDRMDEYDEVRKFMSFKYIQEWRKKKKRSTLSYFVFDIGLAVGNWIRSIRRSQES